MSGFGIFHTAISILPVGFGLAAYLRHGGINLRTRTGKWYVGTMLAGTVSSWGFLPTNGFNEAQVLTLITLFAVLASVFTLRGSWRPAGAIQTIGLNLSYLLLWVFTTETLTRVPTGQPFASGPNDPALLPVRLALLTLFLAGSAFQLRTRRHSMLAAGPVAA